MAVQRGGRRESSLCKSETTYPSRITLRKLDLNLQIDEIHTSLLIRAQMTAMIVVAQNSSGVVPVFKHDSDSGDENQRKMNELAYIHGEPDNVVPVYISWRLNERMYGDLQGQNKTDILSEFGEEHPQPQFRRQ